MKVFLAADHAGFELKNALSEHLFHAGYDVEDLGAKTLDPADDYPQYAYAAATKVIGEDDARAIVVCGSGQGMAIAANRVSGVRASVVWDEATAKETRQDNDSNVLSLPARFINQETAFKIADVWLKTEFSDDARHSRRIKQLDEL